MERPAPPPAATSVDLLTRPGATGIVRIAVAASAPEVPAVQAKLVRALADLLCIVAPFVRTGVSAPAMCDAFDEGVAALRLAASGGEGGR